MQDIEPEPDILLALVNINNSVVSLARAITVSNIHLTRYVEVLVGMGSDSDDLDNKSEEWALGDKEVACRLDKFTTSRST